MSTGFDALQPHAARLRAEPLDALLAREPDRVAAHTLRSGPLYVNFARQSYDMPAWQALLAQGEAVLVAGSASQTTGNRWGEVSALSIDPVDDCTYWYTGQYYAAGAPPGCTAATCWRTRIGSFRYPGCSGPARGTLSGFVRRAEDNAPIAGARVSTAGGYIAFTSALGAYTLALHPSTYAVDATAASYLPASAGGIAIAAGGNATQDFTLGQPPLLVDGFESP